MVWLPFAVLFWIAAFVASSLLKGLLPKPAKKVSPRKELKTDLENILLPKLKSAGFAGPELFKGLDDFFEFRRTQNGVHHFLTIQFEKSKGPEFRINFSEDQEAGIRERLGQMQQFRGSATTEMLETSGGKMQGILTPSCIPVFNGMFWLSARGPYCRLAAIISRRRPAEVLARKALRLYQTELELWWNERKMGAHLALAGLWFSRGEENSLERKLIRSLVWLYQLYGGVVTCVVVVLLIAVPIALVARLFR